MKGTVNKFIIKNGISPETIESPLHIYAGERCILVVDDNSCVGIVWEHYEKRKAKANGQAEIRFLNIIAKYMVYGTECLRMGKEFFINI